MERKMNKLFNEALKKDGKGAPQPPKKPEEGKCTGCNAKFRDEEEDDDEDEGATVSMNVQIAAT
ncbi:hypothetical protein FRB93_012908 [Tulasnella sp. JGI-2019a]|nr:hypothetical protein FRB93_012908 [Tulasnella sp. JGI-2019a]